MKLIMKSIFLKNPLLIFILPLLIFVLFGCVALYFMVRSPAPVPLAAWFVVAAFIGLPLFLLKGFILGFSLSTKQLRQQEELRETLLADERGLSIIKPLFDVTCVIRWGTLDKVLYVKDGAHEGEKFILYCSALPVHHYHPNSWWLNRIFPFKPKRNYLEIGESCRGFQDFPSTLSRYLEGVQTPDFSDPRKGQLLDSAIKNSAKSVMKTELWQSTATTKASQLVYDRHLHQ